MQEQDPFKRKVLLCYISKTKTVEQITQDYGISMGRLYRWIHTFADTNTEDSPSRPDAPAAEAAGANPTFITKNPDAMEQYTPLENLPDDPEVLKKIIEELHYKVHSRDVMIEVAEEKFGIQIKKNVERNRKQTGSREGPRLDHGSDLPTV